MGVFMYKYIYSVCRVHMIICTIYVYLCIIYSVCERACVCERERETHTVDNCCPLLVSSCSFLRLWMAVLVIYPTSQAVVALTFANYVLQPLFPSCLPPESSLRLLATVCLRESCSQTGNCHRLPTASSCEGHKESTSETNGESFHTCIHKVLNGDILGQQVHLGRNA